MVTYKARLRDALVARGVRRWRDLLASGDVDAVDALLCPGARVVLVGNGPVRGSYGAHIDRDYDVVVRFNAYTLDAAKVGTRTDVHVVNDDPAIAAARADVPSVVLGCDDSGAHNARVARVAGSCAANPTIMRDVCAEYDPTRGFLTLAVCLAVGCDVTLVGFGGIGHHGGDLLGWMRGYIASLSGAHDMGAEHRAIRTWVRDPHVKLRALEPLAPSANVGVAWLTAGLVTLTVALVVVGLGQQLSKGS